MKNRRKKLVVDWQIQGRMLLLVLIPVLLTLILAGSVGWYAFYLLDTAGILEQLSMQPEITNSLLRISLLAFLGVMALLCLSLLVALRFSNQVVGPIYRIKEDLNAMRQNDSLDLIYTRRGDYHQQLVRSLNNFIINLRDLFEGEENS